MDTTKVGTTLRSVKELSHEVSAQEGRLDYVKSEVGNLTKQRDSLKEEVKNIRAVLEQDAQVKLDHLKKETAKVGAEKQELENRRKELLELAQQVRQEKSAFESEKANALAMKDSYQKMNDKVGQFVRMVKQGAESL